MLDMSVTLETSQVKISWLKEDNLNMPFIVVTLETSQVEMLALKVLLVTFPAKTETSGKGSVSVCVTEIIMR